MCREGTGVYVYMAQKNVRSIAAAATAEKPAEELSHVCITIMLLLLLFLLLLFRT